MQMPLISRAAHDLMVAALRDRIAELETERNFYRDQWARKEGAVTGFREVPVSVSAPAPVPVSPKSFGAGWRADDWEAYKNWQEIQREEQPGLTLEELQARWLERYGPQMMPVELELI